MFSGNAYTNQTHAWRMHFNLRFFLLIISIITELIVPVRLSGQQEYDEIPVFLDVPGIGATELTSVIRGNDLYLPVTDLFDFLRIRNVAEADMSSISGFFINPDAKYVISRTENKVDYQGKIISLIPGDLIRTETNLYLKSTYFGKVFGLDCNFNFRNMSVSVISKLELPLIREMRLEEMRKNLSKLKGESKADTMIGRTYPLFKFGMADWSAIATEEINGRRDATMNMALGAMVAGGEATANLYYNTDHPFTEKQQNYLWRYVNNDFSAVRQVMAGKLVTNATSSIYDPVIGARITNTPTTYRRSFGSYTLSDKTEPGWIVELYVNNVLVDYAKADASGFFTFQVPLVYGNSMVRLKFYGPWGEEKVREQNISIPFNFLPGNTFEYSATFGIVEDTLRSRFSRANFNYGLTRYITVGGGLEYLSSVVSAPAMPFINTSIRVTNNLLFSGDYTYGVRARGTLTYRLPSNMQLDINYSWYDKNQKAINYNYREERKVVLSTPLRIGKFLSYQRFSFYQLVIPGSKYTTGEWLFSGSLLGINTNITTYSLFIDRTKPNVYSNISLAFRLPLDFVIMPQAQVGYTNQDLISAKLVIEKRLLVRGYLNMSYEQLFITNSRFAELGFRYDFSFAQAGASVRQSNKTTSFVQYARGSLINDSKTKYLNFDNRTNVGKGGIAITAFVDINSNGKRDPGEPAAYGLNLRASGGRIVKSDRDSTIRILALEPYTSCFIELDENSFENISWRLPFRTLNVAVDPEIVKNIDIPVMIVGEATGNVFLQKENNLNGLGKIIVSLYKAGNKPAGKALTENDGYYNFFGLKPGKYSVRIDTVQLNKLGLETLPDSIAFTIKAGSEGDIVNGLNFTLRSKILVDTTKKQIAPAEQKIVRKDTSFAVIHEMSEVVYTIDKDSWAIQIGAFKSRALAERFKKQLEKDLGKKVEITVAGEYYRVRILDLATRADVDENIIKLNKLGFRELWIIRLLARQQQIVLKETVDTLRQGKEISAGKPEQAIIPAITVQLGAFREKSNALALYNRLYAKFGNKVRIVFEKGFFKLRLAGIPLTDRSALDAIKKLEPALGELGLKDVWLVPVHTPVAEETGVSLKKEVPVAKVKVNINIPTFAKPVTTPVFKLRETIIKEAKPVPTISIRVGQFYRKGDALRAQRKIASKLGLQAEILQRYDYYIVVIRGFYTREETYKYYPELAGIGYPGVTLIEDK